MRTVIIDDEPDAVDSLELIIEDFLPELAITNTFTDPVKALKKLPHINPDLIFLDINMPGLNGFQLLEKLENFDFNVIFTTAYDEYAIKAFKFGAANYLLKPIDIDDLIAAVKRIMAKSNKENTKRTLNHVRSDVDNKISITSIDGVHFLKPQEIIYLFSERTLTNIVLKSGKEIIVKKPLKEFENSLPSSFFRIHNSYVINSMYVKKLIKSDTWNVEMDNTEILPISRRRRTEFVQHMDSVADNTIN
jgi:two-component system LytT family response regulator